MSCPERTWTTPLTGPDGNEPAKPHPYAGSITSVTTDPADVVVEVPKELKRFHVALRMGSQGMTWKLTDASSRKLRSALAKATEKHGNAFYEFDYERQEAVVFVPERTVPIAEWMSTLTPAPSVDGSCTP